VAISRLLAAAGVVCAGLLAALPFRQTQPRPMMPPATRAPLDLPLRREDIVLFASPQAEISPAANLQAILSARVNRPAVEATQPVKRTFELMNLAPPPPLPIAFQPAAASDPPPAGDWRPVSREPPRVVPIHREQPRPYRLRDGDTLENIAERYLGGAARAGEIFEANREVLARPDLLPVGKTILIPPKGAADSLTPVQ
jgi:nucleoid-associated protein YgaU